MAAAPQPSGYGFAGDSHTANMAAISQTNAFDTADFYYRAQRLTDFKTHNLHRLVLTYPDTKAIVYSFSNDIDSLHLRNNPNGITKIADTLTHLAIDTMELGVLPFIISPIPRTITRSTLSIHEILHIKTQLEHKIKTNTQRECGYEVLIDLNDITRLHFDGVHLTEGAYTTALHRCTQHIQDTLEAKNRKHRQQTEKNDATQRAGLANPFRLMTLDEDEKTRD